MRFRRRRTDPIDVGDLEILDAEVVHDPADDLVPFADADAALAVQGEAGQGGGGAGGGGADGPGSPISGDGPEPPAEARTRVNRTVWVMAAVAVGCLAAGLVLGMFVKSPAQIAAETAAPEPGPITVEVEERVISSDIVARGDAVYDDATSLDIETSDIGGPAIVTGGVPEVGATLEAGGLVLEVAGRPVLALAGDLPTYRTLRAGVSGPDVVQLQAALGALGIDAGSSGTYDSTTADAVAQLFARAGYPAPEPPEGAREALRAAEDMLRSAQEGLAQAQAALTQAQAGPSRSERVAADNAVNAAQRAYDEARACTARPAEKDPETGAALPSMCPSVAEAQDQLTLTKAQRDELLAAPNTSGEVASRDAAERSVEDAKEELAQARQGVLTPLPASEVVYLAELPRRVDAVDVKRGTVITGPVMTVSGTTLEIVTTMPDENAALLSVGDPADLIVGDTTLPATIAEIGNAGSAGESGRTRVTMHPVDLTEEQRSAIAGSNVRVRIPVSSTDGAVMAVPLAALTAGAGGESRVEVLREGADTPELVVVTTGLSANGYAEITSSAAPLRVGDLIVVGQSDGSVSEAASTDD